jgi:hypothetical protein
MKLRQQLAICELMKKIARSSVLCRQSCGQRDNVSSLSAVRLGPLFYTLPYVDQSIAFISGLPSDSADPLPEECNIGIGHFTVFRDMPCRFGGK